MLLPLIIAKVYQTAKKCQLQKGYAAVTVDFKKVREDNDEGEKNLAKTNRKFADGACDGCHPDRGVECRKGECAGGGNVTGDILVDPRENLLANGDFEAYAKEWNFNFAQESKILWSAITASG